MLLQNWIRLLYSLNHKQRFAMYRITFIAHANGGKLCHLLFVLFYGHCMLYCLCHWIESITPCVMDHAISDVFTSVNYDLHPQYTIHIKLYHLQWMDGWMVCGCCCGVQRRTRKLLPPRSTIDINQDDFMVLELERVPWLVSCLTFRHIKSLCSN